jgi:hypothetical protein
VIDVAPRGMFAAGGIVKLIAKKAVLAVEQKMEKCTGGGESPDPAAQRHALTCSAGIREQRDYSTFFGAMAGAALESTTLAEIM